MTTTVGLEAQDGTQQAKNIMWGMVEQDKGQQLKTPDSKYSLLLRRYTFIECYTIGYKI